MVSIDQFGLSVSLNYKGEGSFKTKVGAILTLLAYTIIGAYVILKSVAVFGKT